MLRLFKKKSFCFTILFIVILFAAYIFHLNHVIVSRFEARRWNLPSRIYSDTFTLFPGKAATINELKSRLQHLGYREASESPKQAGQYNLKESSFEVYLHNFQYPYENFQGFPIRFEIKNHKIINITNSNTNETLKIANLEPELIASIFDDKMEDRTFVALDQIPRILTQAVILIEDERFLSHHGIDPIGILRAFFINLTKGHVVQGGSTLTQQMVKNFFLSHEKTLIRKVNEALMAVIIDLRYSKNDILEVYLNEIYFGQRGSTSITGVQEASRFYFSKNVSQLTPDESALIAAIIKSPGLYSPFINPDNAKERRNLILERLKKNQVIDEKAYLKAKNRPLPQKDKFTKKTIAPYFIDYVKKQLKENFPINTLNSEGLRIYTTLDTHLQRIANKAVQETLTTLEKQRSLLKKNAKHNKFLEGSLITLSPKTGFIRAYVGGRDFAKSQFDIISLAKRQPGSTFKPFAFLTAINPTQTEPVFTASSIINDIPLTLKTGDGNWKPQNYDNKFHGPVRLREALEKSYNVATVWLSQEVGLDKIVKTAKQAGMNEGLKPFPSLVLGAFEVTPLEMIEAYTIFPNNGARSTPIAIRRVVTPDGNVLEKKSFEMQQIFPNNAIYIMNKIMEGVMDRGTGMGARIRGFDKLAAGKTGTTSDYRDSWFVGFTPDLLTLSWVGYTDNQTTGLSGASGALPIWTSFMKKATKAKTYKDFRATEDIIILPIEKRSGLIYKASCHSPFIEEYFIEGTEPTEFCKQ